MKTVAVAVRLRGSTYVARAGWGALAKTASCTSDPKTAALRAGLKALGLPDTAAVFCEQVRRGDLIFPDNFIVGVVE